LLEFVYNITIITLSYTQIKITIENGIITV